jgi:hypothetical protein
VILPSFPPPSLFASSSAIPSIFLIFPQAPCSSFSAFSTSSPCSLPLLRHAPRFSDLCLPFQSAPSSLSNLHYPPPICPASRRRPWEYD